jgi:hypothetical protein
MTNFVPEWVDSKSDVVIEKDADGFSNLGLAHRHHEDTRH